MCHSIMRFFKRWKELQLHGFYWGQFYINIYRRRAGFKFPVMGPKHVRRALWRIGDGMWSQRKMRIPFKKRLTLALPILCLRSSLVDEVRPWAWTILRHLKIRSYSGLRIRNGLPARGQRTHTNARTTRRFNDMASSCLRARYWRYPIWKARLIKDSSKVKQMGTPKGESRRALKQQRSRRGVIRTKDKGKKSQWA